jgi:Na+/melibiose symporter-like transporter
MSTHGSHIALTRAWAYAAPVLATGLLVTSLSSVVPGIYARDYGVPLATIAAITLVTRLLDAFSDPLIGWYSDRWCANGGTRRPFVVAGALAMATGSGLLAFPPSTSPAAWFTAASALVYFGWSAFDISHNAWGTELAPGYAARSRIFGVRAMAFYVGTFVLFMLPMLPGQASRAITTHTLTQAAIAGLALYAVTIPLLLRLRSAGQAQRTASQDSWRDLWRSVAANGPLKSFLAAYFLAGLGFGMYAGLLFLFVDTYLGLTSEVAFVFALGSPVAIASIPVWVAVTRRIGKKATWFTSMALLGTLLAVAGLLAPGPHALAGVIAITLAVFAFGSAQVVVAPALLADIADYGRWKFRQDRTASYYAAMSIVSKAITAVGGAAGLGLAGLLGFDPAVRELGPDAVLGLKLAAAWIPAACVAASLPFIARAPITQRRLAAIQTRIARRAPRTPNAPAIEDAA